MGPMLPAATATKMPLNQARSTAAANTLVTALSAVLDTNDKFITRML